MMTSSETDVLMILFPKTSRVVALGVFFISACSLGILLLKEFACHSEARVQ